MKYEKKEKRMVETEVTVATIKPSEVYDSERMKENLREILKTHRVVGFDLPKEGQLTVFKRLVSGTANVEAAIRDFDEPRFIVERLPVQTLEEVWE